MCEVKAASVKKVDVLIAAMNRLSDAIEKGLAHNLLHDEGHGDAGRLRRAGGARDGGV